MSKFKRPRVSIEKLKELLSYDPDTGLFIWKISKGKGYAGNVAGNQNSLGYLETSIGGTHYLLHRLAWFYVYEKWPDQDIDHINGIKSDNRISNLRDVSKSVNRQNLKKPVAGNSSGMLGVMAIGNKFRAQIGIDGKPTYLGHFNTPDEAHQVYLEAKRKHHEGNTL